jgi:stage II sporulation protein D
MLVVKAATTAHQAQRTSPEPRADLWRPKFTANLTDTGDVARFFSVGSIGVLSVLTLGCSGAGLLPATRTMRSFALQPPVARNALVAPARLKIKAVERGVEVLRDVPLEDYVEATILSEFDPAVEDVTLVEKMLEVQAVISRTYALSHRGRHTREGFDLCSTTHCQLYEPARLRTSKWAATAAQAVKQTASMVLWYDSGPIDALFHADCGGHTSAASDVWGGPNPPYLRAESDDGPAKGSHVTWQYETTASELQRVLNSDPRTRVGKHLRSIAIANRDVAGRAQRVTLVGDTASTVRGEDFREVLTRAFGPRSLRSTWFSVSRRRREFVFTGRGYGHGVGLCQTGALARLRAGQSLTSVLAHYFPGTSIVKIE